VHIGRAAGCQTHRVTTAPRPLRARWRVLLLAALTALAALFLSTALASASGLPAAETRVGASHPAVVHVVGVAEHIAAGQHPGRAPSQLQVVVGHCVAAEAGGIGLSGPGVAGGESDAAAFGRSIHSQFDDQLRELSQSDSRFQPGLRSGTYRPDGFYDGDPIELKPNTPSGLRAGRGQLRRYVGAFGTDQGYLYTYDANGTISLTETVTP